MPLLRRVRGRRGPSCLQEAEGCDTETHQSLQWGTDLETSYDLALLRVLWVWDLRGPKGTPSCPSAPGVSENPDTGLLHVKWASPGLFSLLMVLIFCGVRMSSPNFQVVA